MPDAIDPAPLPAVGCVSYLNAKPLIHGVDGEIARVRFDVPARLLGHLLAGDVDLALCPVIDAYRSPEPLVIVPVGGIGCAGPTWTVRLFGRVPIDTLTQVHADTDSHTSVALLRVLMRERYGRDITLIDLDTRRLQRAAPGSTPESAPDIAIGNDVRAAVQTTTSTNTAGCVTETAPRTTLPDDADAVLLIGDKVVTDAPPAARFPHQLDLGHAWHELTGLPFVFAVWMARQGTDLGDLPAQLATQLAHNQQHLDDIVARYAAPHGWPADLARRYLGEVLRYRMQPDALAGLAEFAELAEAARLIPRPRREPTTLHT